MNPARRTALALALLAAALAGCDNSFSPKEGYADRIVVFAVLSNTQPRQIVRLESTYDAEITNPDNPVGKHDITEATVTVVSSKKAYAFHDTLIDAGGGTMKKVWVSYDFQPVEGVSYDLAVAVPGYQPISASVKVPSKPYLQVLPPSAASQRYGVLLSAGAISTIAPPKGFYFRLFLAGKKTVGGAEVEVLREVPWRIDYALRDTTYTKPGRVSSAEFSVEVIAALRDRLELSEGVTGITLLACGFSLDTFLYNYFQTVRGFDDPVSVRMDRPDVSNVANGVGIFGAMIADTLRLSYTSIITK